MNAFIFIDNRKESLFKSQTKHVSVAGDTGVNTNVNIPSTIMMIDAINLSHRDAAFRKSLPGNKTMAYTSRR